MSNVKQLTRSSTNNNDANYTDLATAPEQWHFISDTTKANKTLISQIKSKLTLSNTIFGVKVVIIAGITYFTVHTAYGLYTWYSAITTPLVEAEKSVALEYHTLQTKYDYRWYDYLCPMCLLTKYISNSQVTNATAEHHNHVMHALKGNIKIVQDKNTVTIIAHEAGKKLRVANHTQNVVTIELVDHISTMATRSKTRHSKSNAIAILNQIASQDSTDKRLPSYSNFIKSGPDDSPRFDVSLTYRGTVYNGLGGRTKFEAKTKAATEALSRLQRPYLNRDQNLTLDAWVRDVTEEGIEPNPGPLTQQAIVLGKQFSVTTSPQTLTFSAIPDGTYSAKLYVMGQIGGTSSASGTITFGSQTIAYSVYDDAVFAVDLGPITASSSYVPTMSWSGTASLTLSITLQFEPIAANGSRVEVTNQPIWTTPYGPSLAMTQVKMEPASALIGAPSLQTPRSGENKRRNKAQHATNGNAATMSYTEEEDLTPDDLAYAQLVRDRNAKILAERTAMPNIGFNQIECEARDQAKHQTSVMLFRDHLIHQAGFKNHTGSFYFHATIVCGISVDSNRYAELADCSDLEEPVDCVSVAEIRKPLRSHAVREERQPSVRKHKPQEIKTVEAKSFDRAASLKRIAKKLADEKLRISIWLQKPGSTKFKREVCNLIFGDNWEERQILNEYEWVAFCYFNNIDKATEVDVLLQHDRKYQALTNLQKKIFMESMNADYAKAQAQTHNKVMHALNGNIQTATWKKVEEAESATVINKHNEKAKHLLRGVELAASITTVQGSANPNFTNFADLDRLRADVQQDNQTRVSNCIMPIPSTALIPRSFRTAGALGPSTERLRPTVISLADYYSDPMVPTTLSTQISDQVAQNKSSNWKTDNIQLAGFRNFDITNINVAMCNTSLSLERPSLVLEALHSLFAMNQQLSALNRSQFQLIDQNTVPVGNPQIGHNNSPVFGEACGGDTPVYPFGGGTGTVAFHISYGTVPPEERDMAIVLPSSVMQATDNPGIAVALFCMMMSKYPFNMATITVPTTDAAGANAGNQLYVPNQTLIDIPGPTALNVILPVNEPVRIPSSQAEANSNASYRPQTGASGTTTYPPGTIFDICYKDGYRSYQLTDYLYSWFLQLDITTIKTFIGRLNTVVNFTTPMEAAHDIIVNLTQHFPRLIVSNAAPASALTQALAYKTSYASCLNPTPSTTNWPLNNVLLPDYRGFQFNILLWNKVALGLATSDALRPNLQTNTPPYLGSPSTNFWERLEAWAIASNWNSFYAQLGLTTQCWNEAYTDTASQWTQDLAINLYATTHAFGSLIPSRFGRIVRNMCENRFDRSPALVHTSIGNIRVEISHYERWLPGSTYASCFNIDGSEVTGLPPLNLTDQGIQYLALRIGQYECSYPRPNDSCYAFGPEDGKLQPCLRDAAGSVACPMMENVFYWPLDAGPEVCDHENFDRRIWYTTTGRVIANWQMGMLPETFLLTALSQSNVRSLSTPVRMFPLR